MQWLKQSTAVSKIVGPILDSSGVEYASAVIGDLSLSKNGGTLTALAATATLTYIANGYYTLALTTGNTDTLGSAEVSVNKSGYQAPPREFMVLPATVYDALVTNATTATGGLGDIQRMAGTALTARDIGASVLLTTLESPVQHSGTAQAGASTTITLAAGASSVTDYYVGALLKIYGGTGAGQGTRTITAYNGSTKVATVGRAFATNPDNTSTYAVLAEQSPVLDSSLRVTSLISSGTGTGQLDVTSGRIKADTVYWNASAVATPDTAGYPKTTIKSGTGTGEVNLTSGRCDANLTYIAGSVLDTTTAQIGVDVRKVLGTASAGAAGYVGVDWGAVTNKTTTNALTGTTIASTQQVDLNTIKTQTVTCSGGVTIPAATLASTTNITAGTITTVTTVTNGVTVTTNNDKTGYSLTQTFPSNFSSFSIDTNGFIQLKNAALYRPLRSK